MNLNKKIKNQLIKEASSNPEKYFPIKTLKSFGMKRQKCENCGKVFWSVEDRKVCGDISCIGSYNFIGNTPAKVKLEFGEVYKRFREFFEKRGYKHLERFPIVARWRDDLDFNIASIIGFQPYVTKGIIPAPAPEVIIPQNCLRFGDIDNVGYTGRHGTNFVMIGQAAFRKPDEYNQEKYFKDLMEWFIYGMGISIEEIQVHEDAWVGGGDCGPSIEFFSRGLELANQVYMWFDMSSASDISELKPLKLKVLDMGMGLERCCWFSKGSVNQYEASMPKTCEYLFNVTNFKPNFEIYNKFIPYSGNLNLDETDDIDKEWENIAKEINIGVEELKREIEPIAGIYSIADHTRTLLYALNDGALPSNVKGGYNLRLVLRRALDFIYKFNWNIDLKKVLEVQADEVKTLYPEMKDNLAEINKIIDFEVEKYKEHKQKVKNKINNIVKNNSNLNERDFIKFYISDGITPYEIKDYYREKGLKIDVPSNFFSKVNQYFEEKKNKGVDVKADFENYVKDLPPTERVYYKNSCLHELENSKIIKEFEKDGKNYIILDKTIFYPEMGGQACDIGFIGNRKVKKVFIVNNVIIHEVE